jgi:hypothetical protein
MVKKSPGMVLKPNKGYSTKTEAKAAAVKLSKEKKKQGYKYRHDTYYDEGTNTWKIKEMYYNTDKKGNLL